MPESCPVCESSDVEVFLRRAGVPVHQNLVTPTAEAAVGIMRGDLNLAVCRDCGFVFNTSFDLLRLSYGDAYDNNQACSATFQRYLSGLVRHLTDERGVRNCRIVDVGCGGGDFLRRLVTAPGAENRGVGFDPAYRGPDIDCDGRVRFERRFYGPDCADTPADVVVCRHVIEHVPRPVELLRTVRQALTGSPHARVYFETPDAAWILRKQVLCDLFYEHCSLFTAQSLTTAFERAGFCVSEVDRVFGGQYLWLEASLGHESPVADRAGRANPAELCAPPGHWAEGHRAKAFTPSPLPDGFTLQQSPQVSRNAADTPALTRQYAACETGLLRDWSASITALRGRGKIAVWGAGAKGVTFVNLIDTSRERIDCVVDLNPKKQGGFVPGTAHPIVDFRALPSREVKTAIVMNPNYVEENRDLLRAAGIELDLIGYEGP